MLNLDLMSFDQKVMLLVVPLLVWRLLALLSSIRCM
jgi:hypothetical protein